MDLIGKMIAGRYEILEEIGKGGMAHVYKAKCHFLDRLVAVKVLKEELKDDKEFVHRFNTEAQAAARISNPHIVSIYDVGMENGLYYIVMEYVEGITLKEYIAEKRILSWRQAADFAAQICEGLEEAHKKSVIHRDIKPQNIIMTKDGVLKVTDFGIARATSQATTTAGNSTIGTVHYLSPEQARGGYTNESTDIYSLGVVLYEMITGRLPFDDNSPVAIAIKHIQEKPILPRILNNDIPKSMEYIVMKAMSKKQEDRYASAGDFLNDLRSVIKNPNAEIGVTVPNFVEDDDEMGSTRKRNAIDDEAIENYKKSKSNKSEYDEYAKKIDDEMEESRLRSIDRKREIREQKQKERRITIAAIVAAIAVITGMYFVFSAISGGGIFGIFAGGEKIEIPNVIDMKLEEAQKKYKDEGFSVIKQAEKASDKEPGTILEQDPPAGSDVNKRDDIIIRVVISKGSANKPVGKYIGLKVDEAKRMAALDDFRITIVEKESSSEEKGIVLSQDPIEGTVISEGGLVTLYVSKGDGDDEEEDDNNEDNNEDKPNTSGNQNNNNTSNNENNSNNNSNNNTNDTPNNSTGNETNSGNGNETTNTETPNNTGGNEGSGNTTSSENINNNTPTPGISD